MKIIVTDSKYKMTLAPVRSLAKAGHRVICCDYESTPKRKRLGALSRFSCGSVSLPYEENGLVSALVSLAASGERPVLFPSGRRMLDVVSRRAELADKFDMLVSPPDVLDAADDKGRMRALAENLGIAVPHTVCISDYPSVNSLAEDVRYPCIVKYRNGEALGLKSWERYSIVHDKPSFLWEYSRMSKNQPDPIAQDYLTGSDVGIAVVADRNSDIVDFICYVSHRTYPISGGPTCLCETVFDRSLLISAAKLIKALGFVGVAMLDFRHTEKGDFFLEINPRLWGSAYLCTVAGSGFFESYALAARGEAKPLDVASCEPSYKLGARMRFTPQAAAAVMQEVKRGSWGLLPRALLAAFNPRVKDGVYKFTDSRPYFHYIFSLLRGE